MKPAQKAIMKVCEYHVQYQHTPSKRNKPHSCMQSGKKDKYCDNPKVRYTNQKIQKYQMSYLNPSNEKFSK
jgi:hypothetical protein